MNNYTSVIHKIVADSGIVSVNNQNYTVHNFSHVNINLLGPMFELYLYELNNFIFHSLNFVLWQRFQKQATRKMWQILVL